MREEGLGGGGGGPFWLTRLLGEGGVGSGLLRGVLIGEGDSAIFGAPLIGEGDTKGALLGASLTGEPVGTGTGLAVTDFGGVGIYPYIEEGAEELNGTLAEPVLLSIREGEGMAP